MELSLQNVLNISKNLRLGVLINFVLIKKRNAFISFLKKSNTFIRQTLFDGLESQFLDCSAHNWSLDFKV